MTRDMRTLDLDELAQVVGEQPYPLVFATVSGAHLYGFPSVDSDVDLRGVHVLPLRAVVGLQAPTETESRSWDRDGMEMDLVTHDIAKFSRLLLKRNGYVLEQLLSPLVVTTSEAHAVMREAAPGCLTRHHAHHYLGFTRTQWTLFGKVKQLKPLLYTFRVLLTGIHLMRTGELEANLNHLVELEPAPSYLPDLIEHKQREEHGQLPDGAPTLEQLAADVDELSARLEAAAETSSLPEAPSSGDVLNDLLLQIRLATV